MSPSFPKAQELQVECWLNAREDVSLAGLRGKVVVVFAFQMLCPGCVEYSIPQAKKVYEIFDANKVAVIGLHTVFEHHSAMTEISLKAFLHEYRIYFPVAIDRPSHDGVPDTMRDYNMGGTPTLLLIDKKGNLRKHTMGHEQDLVLGSEIMSLIMEP